MLSDTVSMRKPSRTLANTSAILTQHQNCELSSLWGPPRVPCARCCACGKSHIVTCALAPPSTKGPPPNPPLRVCLLDLGNALQESGCTSSVGVAEGRIYTHERQMLMNMKGAYLERTIPIPTYRRKVAVDKQRDIQVANILMRGVWSKQTPAGPEA